MKMIILIFISCAAQIYKKMALENSEKFLILQLQDGPCPLVALVNFILLTSKSNIAVPETEDLNNAWIFDTLERHLINNEIMERGKVISTMTGFFDGTYLSPVLKSSIEFEKEILSNLFLHFNVKLFHCWVASEKVLNAFDAIDVRDVNMLSYLLTFSDMRKEHIAALRRELDETRVSIGRYEQDVQNLDQSLGDDLIDGSLTERKRLTEIISDLRAREEHLIRLDGDEGEKLLKIFTEIQKAVKQQVWEGVRNINSKMDIGEVAIMFMGNHFHVIQKITDEQIRTVDTYGDRKEKVIQWKPVEVEDIDMRSIFDWAA